MRVCADRRDLYPEVNDSRVPRLIFGPRFCHMLNRCVLLLPFLLPVTGNAQSFNSGGGLITDDASPSDFPIVVSGLDPGTLDTVSFGVERVCFSVLHPWTAHLEIALVAPDGTSALLVSGRGSDGDNFTQTCIRTDIGIPLSEGWPPYTGTFQPDGPMGRVNNGQNGNGTWLLRITDMYPGEGGGQLVSAQLHFGDEPATYFNLVSTNLPIVVIDTEGAAIPNEPKIPAHMGIIYNGVDETNELAQAFNDFDGRIGIETRGNSSQQFLKRSYGIELWDTLGEDINAPLIGMPAESDWVLIAQHSDKSLLNNALTFDLATRMGHYAPRWKHVEVVLNGEPRGVYLLTEKIKRDGNRVDIANLQPTDTIGGELTGGYIIKIDWAEGTNSGQWFSDFAPPGGTNGQTIRFLFDYPGEPVAAQRAYIEAYVDSFEYALASPQFADPLLGFRAFLDERSFQDYFLLNELGRNVDGYRQSTFLHKDKDSNGGLLHMGPVWDFDLAWHNSNYCAGSDVEGWNYRFADHCPTNTNLPPFWWGRLMEDPTYANALRCRWEELREDVLSQERLMNWCDSMALELEVGQQHNFSVWPILGTWVWPNPYPLPANYAEEIAELKTWIMDRGAWLDEHLPGTCSGLAQQEADPLGTITVYPQPAADFFHVQFPSDEVLFNAQLIDVSGRVYPCTPNRSTGMVTFTLPNGTTAGLYILRLKTARGSTHVPIMLARQ
jgi:hypothetical protein